MKNKIFIKILLTIFIVSNISFICSAQKIEEEYFDTKNHYVSVVYINYSIKKTGITSRILMNIGTSQNHPLRHRVANINDQIVVQESGRKEILDNEVDLFNFLFSEGWSLEENVVNIRVAGLDYYRYVFRLKN